MFLHHLQKIGDWTLDSQVGEPLWNAMLTSRSWKARPDVLLKQRLTTKIFMLKFRSVRVSFGLRNSWHNETMLNMFFLKMKIEHSIIASFSFGFGVFCLGLSINIYCTPFTRIDRAFLRKWWCLIFAHCQGWILLALRRDEEELCWLCWIQVEIEPMKDSVYINFAYIYCT